MTNEDNENFKNSIKCWICDDSHVFMQEQGKLSLKTNVLPNGLEKYLSFSINTKLSFTDSLQFLSSSFDSLIKN